MTNLESNKIPSEVTIAGIEKFICQIYQLHSISLLGERFVPLQKCAEILHQLLRECCLNHLSGPTIPK